MKNTVLILLLNLLSALTTSAYSDVPSTHGMILFGKKLHYASHLPMFHYPHNYQLIMKLALNDLQTSPTGTLYQQAKDEGKTLFTLVPERMDLNLIIRGEKKAFKAYLYDGPFERGGKELGPINVQIEKIIYSSKIPTPKED
jgi:hypothetical protein